MADVEIRNLTRADVLAFYGRDLRSTVRGWSVWQNNELAAICGVTMGPGVMVAFSDIKPDIVAPKVTVWRTALRIMEKIKALDISTVYAVASPKLPGAPAFLARLGFKHVESSVRGEVFIWQIRSQ